MLRNLTLTVHSHLVRITWSDTIIFNSALEERPMILFLQWGQSCRTQRWN